METCAICGADVLCEVPDTGRDGVTRWRPKTAKDPADMAAERWRCRSDAQHEWQDTHDWPY